MAKNKNDAVTPNQDDDAPTAPGTTINDGSGQTTAPSNYTKVDNQPALMVSVIMANLAEKQAIKAAATANVDAIVAEAIAALDTMAIANGYASAKSLADAIYDLVPAKKKSGTRNTTGESATHNADWGIPVAEGVTVTFPFSVNGNDYIASFPVEDARAEFSKWAKKNCKDINDHQIAGACNKIKTYLKIA